jgi:hypothetical protein
MAVGAMSIRDVAAAAACSQDGQLGRWQQQQNKKKQ